MNAPAAEPTLLQNLRRRKLAQWLLAYAAGAWIGLQVLGLNRHGRNILAKLSRVSLRVGDVLLIQGRTSGMARIADEGQVSVLHAVEERLPDPRHEHHRVVGLDLRPAWFSESYSTISHCRFSMSAALR